MKIIPDVMRAWICIFCVNLSNCDIRWREIGFRNDLT